MQELIQSGLKELQMMKVCLELSGVLPVELHAAWVWSGFTDEKDREQHCEHSYNVVDFASYGDVFKTSATRWHN